MGTLRTTGIRPRSQAINRAYGKKAPPLKRSARVKTRSGATSDTKSNTITKSNTKTTTNSNTKTRSLATTKKPNLKALKRSITLSRSPTNSTVKTTYGKFKKINGVERWTTPMIERLLDNFERIKQGYRNVFEDARISYQSRIISTGLFNRKQHPRCIEKRLDRELSSFLPLDHYVYLSLYL